MNLKDYLEKILETGRAGVPIDWQSVVVNVYQALAASESASEGDEDDPSPTPSPKRKRAQKA